MSNAYKVVKDFEQAVSEYTGAPYVVAVDSCTNAIFLSLIWMKNYAADYWEQVPKEITIPNRTYLSVPIMAKHAGFKVNFENKDWSGIYSIKPFTVYDSARRFTSNMYSDLAAKEEGDDYVIEHGTYLNNYYMCTSHHWTKPLGIERGGCILHNDAEADIWLRKARFHGRTEGVHPRDDNPIMGWNMMMLPSVAANGLVRLSHLPKDNPDLPNDDYPDLSQMELFK